jgi:hypothetical protein
VFFLDLLERLVPGCVSFYFRVVEFRQRLDRALVLGLGDSFNAGLI